MIKKVKWGPTNRPTDRPTNQPTDRRTDKAGCTRLKRKEKIKELTLRVTRFGSSPNVNDDVVVVVVVVVVVALDGE